MKNITEQLDKLYIKLSVDQRPFINDVFVRNKRESFPLYDSTKQPSSSMLVELYTNIKNKYNIVDFTKPVSDDKLKNRVAQYILYRITGDPCCKYYWGLYSKIFTKTFNANEDIRWMYLDYMKTKSPQIVGDRSLPFNITYINQSLEEGIHRSGWNYVTENMFKGNNSSHNILLDLYVDRTFLWCCDIYKDVGVIPYTKSWVGIIHHTPNTEYNNNNLVALLKEPTFMQSLKTCKAIVVLSNYLKNWLQNQDVMKGIRIESVVHPTEMCDVTFDMDKFTANANKKIIQIGAWLRNPYAIYQLDVNDYTKCQLKGLHMNHCVKPNDIDLVEIDFTMCRSSNDNKYLHYLDKFIKELLEHNKFITKQEIIDILNKNHESVAVINYLTNEKYDELLSENIVFLNLVDVSACNTLIECVTRNTPIVINKLPAIVEHLGEDYPLYYDKLSDVTDEFLCVQNINNAYEHLKGLDKSKYSFDLFKQQIVSLG